MNKKLILIFIGLVFLSGAAYLWLRNPFSSSKNQSPISSASSKKTVLVNTLALEERPYIVLEPKSSVEPQSLGHWATMTVDNIDNFNRLEYEFEYTNGQMIQGGMGRIDFSQERPPVSKEIAFGSASRGKYKYDEGVNSGKFTYTFFKGSEESVLKTDFSLLKNSDVDGVFSSFDKKVNLQTSKGDLEQNDYLLISSTLGLPKIPEGKVLEGPYGFYTDSPRKLNNTILVFTGTGEENVAILWWNGTDWQEYATEIKQGGAWAKIDNLGTFVLIKK